MGCDQDQADRDRGAFLALLQPIERELEIYCRRLIWDPQSTPDALQNTLLRAVKGFNRYREGASFRAWIYQILTREIFAMNRRHARRAQHEFQVTPEELEALSGQAASAANNSAAATLESLKERLDDRTTEGLKALTNNERAVLLLRAIGGFRYREIGLTLDIPLGSVMGHLSRARKKMRALIKRQPSEATTNWNP
jgi:RNA polymerase sigma-70 factor (ECF subfamily)